jgi:transcriptional regulator with XRE-family HTH domain
MTKFSENFATNLVRLRKSKELTQQELADALGVNKQQLSEFERGRRTPNFEVLDRIAEYFQATPNQIFGSSQEIELEYAVLQTDEYNERAKETLTLLKKIEQYFDNPDFMNKVNEATYLTVMQPLFNERGEELSWKIDEYGNVDKSRAYTQREIENTGGHFIAAYESETPLEKFLKMK